MNEDREYQAAREHVRAHRGLRSHALVYVLVNTLLIAINIVTPGNWWFQWPLLGWGIGLAVHAVIVLGGFWSGSDSEDEEIRRYLEDHAAR